MNRQAKRNRSLLILALAAGLVPAWAPTWVQASADTERTALARLAHEIQSLNALVREAEALAPGNVRVPFQYGWLRGDLLKIRGGIVEYLNAPRGEPRSFPPLQGDYRR